MWKDVIFLFQFSFLIIFEGPSKMKGDEKAGNC